jgi:hypothetical protein
MTNRTLREGIRKGAGWFVRALFCVANLPFYKAAREALILEQ